MLMMLYAIILIESSEKLVYLIRIKFVYIKVWKDIIKRQSLQMNIYYSEFF